MSSEITDNAPLSIEDFVSALGMNHSGPILVRLTTRIGVAARRVVEHLTYLDFRSEGVSLLFEKDGGLDTVFFYSDGYEGHKQYAGSLPRGISFGDSEAVVDQRLGGHATSGGGEIGILGKRVPRWRKYSCGSYCATVQFGEENRGVALVSLAKE